MGYYIDPKKSTKENWLEKHGIEYQGWRDAELIWLAKEADQVSVVVLVDNGPFSAAGIAYSKEELAEFTRPSDYRPKKIYLVPTKAILEEHPEFAELLALESAE